MRNNFDFNMIFCIPIWQSYQLNITVFQKHRTLKLNDLMDTFLQLPNQ